MGRSCCPWLSTRVLMDTTITRSRLECPAALVHKTRLLFRPWFHPAMQQHPDALRQELIRDIPRAATDALPAGLARCLPLVSTDLSDPSSPPSFRHSKRPDRLDRKVLPACPVASGKDDRVPEVKEPWDVSLFDAGQDARRTRTQVVTPLDHDPQVCAYIANAELRMEDRCR
jgi:hypothetical protein